MLRFSLPHHWRSHALALSAAVSLHAGIAAWAMMPSPPIAMPQQQVIHITMVAPTIIRQEQKPEPAREVKKEFPNIPPKEKGMVKVEPRRENVKETEKKPEKEEPKKLVRQQAKTQLTSGLQANNATEKKAAITEPVAAAYLNNPPPEYPHIARRRKQQGMVMLDVRVSKEGAPEAIEISRSSGYDVLDEAALDAVRRWKFVPARRGSQLVEASVVVPVEFRIN